MGEESKKSLKGHIVANQDKGSSNSDKRVAKFNTIGYGKCEQRAEAHGNTTSKYCARFYLHILALPSFPRLWY